MGGNNFSELCRICGETVKDQFEGVDDHEEIYKFLPIKESDNDFPRSICAECVSSLENWNAFYNRCEDAQKKFGSLLKQKKTRNTKKQKKEPAVEQCEEEEIVKPTTPSKLKHSCNFCKTSSESQEQLNAHLIAVHCDLVFCCDLCKNYKPRDDLIAHMTEHALSSLQSPAEEDSSKTDKIQCPECDKEFTSNGGLKYHINSTHSPGKRFACDECEHIFPCKRVLLNHFRSVHSKEKEFKCSDCDKRFKTDSTLYAHYKTHSKETPYKCFDCGKGFKFKHHLDVHSVQHGPKEKKFECTFCQKKFAVLNNLTKHRKIHDKTMDFVCHICGVKTLQKRYLREHMKRVHQTRLESTNLIC